MPNPTIETASGLEIPSMMCEAIRTKATIEIKMPYRARYTMTSLHGVDAPIILGDYTLTFEDAETIASALTRAVAALKALGE